MNRIAIELKRGIFGTGWKNALAGILLAAALFCTSLVYALLNHGPYVLFLKTPLDELIPVIPFFAIPYVSLEPYVYASLIVFLLFRTRVFRSAAFSMLAAWYVSYAFYIFLQSYMDRPVLAGNDFFTSLINNVYAGDNPYNCFPSLHTSVSTIIAFHWWRIHRTLGIVAGTWTGLIVLSTVFIKQHYVPDIAAGLALAFAASVIFAKLFPEPGLLPEPSHRAG